MPVSGDFAGRKVIFYGTLQRISGNGACGDGCCAFVSMALGPVFGQEQYAQIPMAVVDIVMKFFQIVISAVIIVKTYRDLDAPAPRAR